VGCAGCAGVARTTRAMAARRAALYRLRKEGWHVRAPRHAPWGAAACGQRTKGRRHEHGTALGRVGAPYPRGGAGRRRAAQRPGPHDPPRPRRLAHRRARPARPRRPRLAAHVHRPARRAGQHRDRWGLLPVGLAPSGAFLDAVVWPTTATAARHNAQAHAQSAHGEGGAVLPALSLGDRAALAPTAWARGYRTPTHCTLLAGETYRNVQFTVALYSDHTPRSCAPEQAWLARALRLLWAQADAYARARRP